MNYLFNSFKLITLWTALVLMSLPQAKAQSPVLVHLKKYHVPPEFILYTEASDYGLHYYSEDSLYTLKVPVLSETFQPGVWSDDPEQELNTAFSDKVILYDQNFNTLKILQFREPNRLNVIGATGQSVFFNAFRWYNSDIDLEAIPEIQWTHSSTDQNRFVLEYNRNTNTLAERVSVRDSVHQLNYLESDLPYLGYIQASGSVYNMRFYNLKNMTLLNNSTLVGGVNFFQKHWVNQTLYQSTSNNFGYLQLQYQIEDHNTVVTPVGPFPGVNMFNFMYFQSEHPDSYYRIGSFRGTMSTINPGGDLFVAPNDSAYVTYISRENINGESEFITPLYSFNNFRKDTSWFNLVSQQGFHSLVESDGLIYLSERFLVQLPIGDSLQFTNYFGNDSVYVQMIDSIIGGSIPYSKDLIYAISDNGEPQIKLSMINKYLGNTELWYQSQQPKLYKVNNLLAWVSNYWAHSDTTIALVKETSGNTIDTTFIDLPAGKGVCIYWLNSDLSLVDFWNIPYTSSGLEGVRIDYIGKYGPDTLLIQGYINANTYTTLEPYGGAVIPFAENTSFLAFYAGLNSVNVKEATSNPGFSIFPNPASGTITVKQAENTDFNTYSIYDLSGKNVKAGSLPKGHSAIIEIDKITPGMYILKCTGKDQTSSTKFVVK